MILIVLSGMFALGIALFGTPLLIKLLSRRDLVAGGLPDDKLLRVEGLSSTLLRLPDQPRDPANRRISLVVLTREAEERLRPLGTPAQIEEPAEPPSPSEAGPAPLAEAATDPRRGTVELPRLQIAREPPKAPAEPPER